LLTACIAFLFLGMAVYQQAALIASDDISHYAGQTVRLTGEVVEVPDVAILEDGKIRIRYTVAIRNIAGTQGVIAASGGLHVAIRQAMAAPRAIFGDEVTVWGPVLLPHGYNNPGLVDTVAGLQRKGITARMVAAPDAIAIQSAGQEHGWKTVLAAWRESMTANMQKVMPAGDAAILTGMLLGGYTGIKSEVVRDFAATGIVHILSVSGTHIALVAGVILWLGARLRIRFGITAIFAGISILFYGLLSGFTPPVVRSIIMGLVSLLAVGVGREKDGPGALSVAVFAMLLYQPALIYDISFQLSTGATAGIVLLYTRTVTKLSFLPAWLGSGLAMTVAAQLGVLPFMAWYFNNFPLASFPANLIVVPLIELAVVLGLFGSLAVLVLPAVGSVVLVACSLIIGTVVLLNAGLADLPGGSLYLPPVGVIGGLAYYLLLAWVYGYRPDFVPGPADLARKAWRRPLWTACLAVGIGAGLLLLLWQPRLVSVHFIDVGQGDATLITTPHGQAIVVDSGGIMGSGTTDFDVGDRVVYPYLKHYVILSIDYLILTHGHQDHAGGAAALASRMLVRNVMVAQEDFGPPVQALLHVMGRQRFIPLVAGQRIVIDGVSVEVLHAAGESQQRPGNEVSAVIRIGFGNHSFLLTGDLEAPGEAVILSKGMSPSTVLKVGHHGARKSTTPAFLQAVLPQYAVISVGSNNRFGHPHPDTLQRLAARGIAVYRTDQQGAIVFTTDGSTMMVEPFLKGAQP